MDVTRLAKIDRFYKDAANGALPGFCIVEPDYGTTSEEDPQNVAAGEAFAAKVIDAVMAALACDRSGPGTIPPPGPVSG
jgi:hypothetical protein